MKLTEAEKEYRRQYYRDNKEAAKRRANEWKAANPEKVRASVRKSMAKRRANKTDLERKEEYTLRRYGLSIEHYTTLYNEQGAACKICRKPLEFHVEGAGHKSAHVDHNHTTGKVRGLLCGSCNRALGLFQDNATILRLAAEYLDASDC